MRFPTIAADWIFVRPFETKKLNAVFCVFESAASESAVATSSPSPALHPATSEDIPERIAKERTRAASFMSRDIASSVPRSISRWLANSIAKDDNFGTHRAKSESRTDRLGERDPH